MDTSKDYVKMCDNATELQESWEPKEGDWFVAECTDWVIGLATLDFWEDSDGRYHQHKYPIPTCQDKESFGWGCKEKMVWLPRIDQLLEMLSEYDMDIDKNGSVVVYTKSKDEVITEYYEFMYDTLEQSLLDAYMYMKYDKKWDGNKWK